VFPADARDAPGRYLEAIARLKPGVSLTRAQAEIRAIAGALAVEFPERNTKWSGLVVPLHDQLSGEYRSALLVLTGAVAFVLLIACANVANLLLARGAARQREIAIRAALGADRSRVIRQLLTESLVLAVIGGALGVLVAQWGLALLLALSPVDLTLADVRLSAPVLAFTAAASIVTAIVCGLAPAFEGSRGDLQEPLKEGARHMSGSVRHRRLRRTFVVSEIALAVVLLIGAGLLLRSLGSLRRVDPGFNIANVLTMRLQLPLGKYRKDADRIRFYREAESRIRSLPGVQSVGAVSFLPMTGQLGAGTDFTIEGRPLPPPGSTWGVAVSVCDNGYFEAIGLPLVAGRWFSEREMREKSDVVIVSDSFARRYFPDGDALGKRVTIFMTQPNVPTEIVGIVGDMRFRNLTSTPEPTAYWPHPQLAYNGMTLTVKTATDPLASAAGIERAIRTLDKDQPVSDVRTMSQWVSRALAQARFSSTLLLLFANVALALAAIGIYGVMSYAVSQRTSEIGIRLALGATVTNVVGMIIADGLRLAVGGLALGLLLALGLNRTITGLLYETSGTDAATFAVVIIVLGGAALLASYLPARRASKIPPVQALRTQ
jgi:putative ABC transport system permease protein